MKKILLVDGTEVSRNFTQIILSTMYATISATCGREAVDMFPFTSHVEAVAQVVRKSEVS